MSIRVFISSTNEDLEKDCRPSVRRAVSSVASAVEMSTWITDFQNAATVCREKIERDSSHYLGIFAYRRGWAPDELGGKSITEAEFDWACEYKKMMAVLLPAPMSEFAEELRQRASGQSTAEAQAQQVFLKKVSGLGTYMPFDDPAHLEGKVSSKVTLWSQGGIRAIASSANTSDAANRKRRALENQLINIGRRKPHVEQFEDCLDVVAISADSLAACFLIHGKSGFGHKEMSKRLLKNLEDNETELKSCRVDIRPDWRQKDVAALIEIIETGLGFNLSSNSIEVLVAQLKILLKSSDVVIEFADLQRLEGSLTNFVEKFWQPLINSLTGADTCHRLICLLAFEQPVEEKWGTLLQMPKDLQASEDFDPSKLIVLPELVNFNESDLSIWLSKRGLTKDNANSWAQTLIDETQGNPALIYRKIEDDLIDLLEY